MPQHGVVESVRSVVAGDTPHGYVGVRVAVQPVEQGVARQPAVSRPHRLRTRVPDDAEAYAAAVVVRVDVGERPPAPHLRRHLAQVGPEGEAEHHGELADGRPVVHGGDVQPAAVQRQRLDGEPEAALHVAVELALVPAQVVPDVAARGGAGVAHEDGGVAQTSLAHVAVDVQRAVAARPLRLRLAPEPGGRQAGEDVPAEAVTVLRPDRVEQHDAASRRRVDPRRAVVLRRQQLDIEADLAFGNRDLDEILAVCRDHVRLAAAAAAAVGAVDGGRGVTRRRRGAGPASQRVLHHVVHVVVPHASVEQHGPRVAVARVRQHAGRAGQFAAVPPRGATVLHDEAEPVPGGAPGTGRSGQHLADGGGRQEATAGQRVDQAHQVDRRRRPAVGRVGQLEAPSVHGESVVFARRPRLPGRQVGIVRHLHAREHSVSSLPYGDR